MNYIYTWKPVLLAILLVTPFAHADQSITHDCDIPIGDLENFPSADAKACAESCAANVKCRGFVFISGWNRCQLKSSQKVRAGIVMHGGEIESGASGARTLRTFGRHTDNTGRDLRQVAPIADESECQKRCATEDLCKGYVWIGGYNVCWLKKTAGKQLNKRFECGIKN